MKKIKIYITILFMICPLTACGIKNETYTDTEEIVDEQEENETEINRVQIIEIEKKK